jgi:hypothetical protein
MKLAISPIHTIDDFPEGFSIDDKIEIFIARVEGWQFGIAQSLIENDVPHRGFALLHIVVSQFEMVGKYRDGYVDEGKSKYYFREGAKYIFKKSLNEDEEFYNQIYTNVRNGMYHVGMTSSRVLLFDDIPGSVGYQQSTGAIVVSPDKFVQDLHIRFQDYASELRNPENETLRRNFEARFDYDNRETMIANSPRGK